MGRHKDLEGALARIYSQPGDNSIIQELHAAPLDDALLTERISQVRDSGVTVAVRVSPQNAREMAPKVIAAGAELLFIQGTLVSAEHVATGGEPLNLKEFIGSLDVPVIAGGVTDYTTALHLMRTGAAGVIVGAGVTTNAETVGIDSAMGTAIADAAAARRDYLDETGGRYVHIIADTEFENSGNIAKAFACGADGVVLGPLLAQAREAGGKGWYWPATAGHPRFPAASCSSPGPIPTWTSISSPPVPRPKPQKSRPPRRWKPCCMAPPASLSAAPTWSARCAVPWPSVATPT